MKQIRRRIILAVCGLISVWILATTLFVRSPNSRSSDSSDARLRRSALHPQQQRTNSSLRFRGGRTHEHRIAIVIPFFGESPDAIPSYLTLFCTAAAGSASLVDFLIIHNGVLEGAYTEPTPDNVIFINLGSTKAFAERLVRVVDEQHDDDHHQQDDGNRRNEKEAVLAVKSRERLVKIVTYHVHQYPYVLVEFKPAIGHIFADLLEGYTHWGYSDLDIAFGDLPRWITHDELVDYDIVTYGYGDQNRLYLRGQFTFHKNVETINQLWRECEYLSHMDVRFANVLAGKTKLRVESAEGCYSAAVLKRKDIRVKYAVKAFNDVEQHDTANTHGLYLGIGSKRRNRSAGVASSVIYKAKTPQDGMALTALSPTWFQDQNNVYGSKERKPIQRQLGKREEFLPERSSKTKKCMYWVPETYQHDICISGPSSNETVFWIDGKLYKQPFENVELPGNVVSSPFFHFQEWKRYYRTSQLASVKQSTDALGWVLSKEGAIPLLSRDSQSRWTSSTFISPRGHSTMQWSAVDDSHREMMPHARYCLTSAQRKNPPRPVVSGCFDSVSWQDKERVEILHGAPVWKHVDVKQEVTLALTLQISNRQTANTEALDGILDLAVANVNAWQGAPCVLVIHMSGATEESISKVKIRIANLETDATLVAMIAREDSDEVSRKALMNMASDAAPTRWVVSGVEVERGLVLSNEASALAYRRAKLQQDVTGSLFIIPQFAIDNQDDENISMSFNDLAEIRRIGEPVVHGPDEYEDGCEDDDDGIDLNAVFEQSERLWWGLSTKEITTYVPNDDAAMHELALEYDVMQLSFTKLLAADKHAELSTVDISPILMVDSIGPEKGLRTSEIAREIEEFGGKRCYNTLRLVQLAALGYTFNVLPGAFAISTNFSRDAAGEVDENDAPGSSRCDGCFMFDEDHENNVKSIVIDERKRPAKAAILWENQKTTTQDE